MPTVVILTKVDHGGLASDHPNLQAKLNVITKKLATQGLYLTSINDINLGVYLCIYVIWGLRGRSTG